MFLKKCIEACSCHKMSDDEPLEKHFHITVLSLSVLNVRLIYVFYMLCMLFMFVQLPFYLSDSI